MRFDRFTISLLTLCADPPELAAEALDALQDQHMAHLAELHETGRLLAAGPLLGPPDRTLRGLNIWRGEPAEVRALMAERPDPMVTAGRLREEVIPWMVPSGVLGFTATRFPRSIAEADG